MKRFISLLSLVLTVMISHAQIDKGTQLISGFGSVSFEADGPGNNDRSGYRVSLGPAYTYFFRNNWGIHLRAGFNMSELQLAYKDTITHYSSTNKNQSFRLSAGLSHATQLYYKLYLQTDLLLMGESGIGENKYTSGSGTSLQTVRTGLVGAYASPGLLYFMTPRLIIHGSFGRLEYAYRSEEIEGGETSGYHTVGLHLNSFSVGLGYAFGSVAR